MKNLLGVNLILILFVCRNLIQYHIQLIKTYIYKTTLLNKKWLTPIYVQMMCIRDVILITSIKENVKSAYLYNVSKINESISQTQIHLFDQIVTYTYFD